MRFCFFALFLFHCSRGPTCDMPLGSALKVPADPVSVEDFGYLSFPNGDEYEDGDAVDVNGPAADMLCCYQQRHPSSVPQGESVTSCTADCTKAPFSQDGQIYELRYEDLAIGPCEAWTVHGEIVATWEALD